MDENLWYPLTAALLTLLSISLMIRSKPEQRFYLLLYQLFTVAMLFIFLAADDSADHYYWLFGMWWINQIILIVNVIRLG